MSSARRTFTAGSRVLHWAMAVMILAMLFIGVGMAATVSDRYAFLVSIHKPLGIAILVLAVLRALNRLFNPPPPLPDDLPAWQQRAATGSHHLLYGLMFLMPLIGWAMLSAAPYPVAIFGPLQLPPVLPQNATVYALLRHAHTFLAFLLFATFLAHSSAALFHGLIRRDGVLQSMASLRTDEANDGA
ncbi:MAG: cytochrome b [Steroidobacteraceae bacterium]|jgi:cytochrome b561